jgi:C-terminal processing protease CtpA/Prc
MPLQRFLIAFGGWDLKALLFFWILIFSSTVSWALETQQQQLSALDTLVSELRVHYGMAQFKKAQFGVDLEQLREKYARLIEQAQTLEEFYGWDPPVHREVLPPAELRQLLMGLVAELKDGHANAFAPIDSYATFGIKPAVLDGRLYVSGLDKDLFDDRGSSETIKVGDEIVSINGVSVQELARRNMIYMSTATHLARWRKALMMTVVRPFRLLRAVSDGEPVRLEFRRKEKVFSGRFHWLVSDELERLRAIFPERFPVSNPSYEDKAVPYGTMDAVRSYFRQGLGEFLKKDDFIIDIGAQVNAELSKKPHVVDSTSDDDDDDDKAVKDNTTEVAKKSKTPAVTPVQRLKGYAFRSEGKMIGVVRIPSYYPNTFREAVNEHLWLGKVLKAMDKLVDVIVIDQVSNGGGYVYLSVRMAGLFAKGRVLKAVTADFKLTETLLRTLSPRYQSEPDSIRDPNFAQMRLEDLYYQNLKKKFEQGERWSGPIPYMESSLEIGSQEAGSIFPPTEGATDKPILVLNDQFSASGGDFFTAILQANRRALIFGETSQGLGGPVYRQISSLPGSEMSLRCTYAYCQRPDKLPIENLGVVPNIHREVTVEDLRQGFKDYAGDAVHAAVMLADGKGESDIAEDIAKRVEKRANVVERNKRLISVRLVLDGFDPNKDSYVSLRKSLAPLISETEPTDWAGVIIPLPECLRKEDVFLASLWKRDEIIERLEQIQNLGRYTPTSKAGRLVQSIIDLLEVLPAEARFANPCLRYLSTLDAVAEKPADWAYRHSTLQH